MALGLAFAGWCAALVPAMAGAGELGANKFDLLLQYVSPGPEGTTVEGYRTIRRYMAQKAIADAHDAGLRFLRVAVTGFRPVGFRDHSNELALWQRDPAAYWALVDGMFDDLDRAGIRLVPTLLWQTTQFAALGGDKLETFLVNPQSKSRQLFAEFLRDFIERYKSRQTILFYELTNEMNLEVDLDLGRRCAARTDDCVGDRFTTAEMVAFSRDIVRAVKTLDPSRQVTSGYALPRPAAAHLSRRPEFAPGGPDWTPDTLAEFRQNRIDIHEPFDMITVHIYPGDEKGRFGRALEDGYKFVNDAADTARSVNKPLFIGEFGDTGATQAMNRLLDEIVRERVAYAAIWIWEYYQFTTYQTRNTPPSKLSVEPGYSDDLIQLLIDTERSLGAEPPNRTKDAPPRVIVTWPLPCSVVDQPVDVIAVASDGIHGAKNVDFFLNGVKFATATAPPYRAHFDPIGLKPDIAKITALAAGAVGRTTEFSTILRLNGSRSACDPAAPNPSNWPEAN